MEKKLKEKICGIIDKKWPSNNRKHPSSLIAKLYREVSPKGGGSRNWNGFLLEALVVKFLRTKIDACCIFTNRKLALIDDTKYDVLLCSASKDGKSQSPICLSIKTSLRERFKQAEREGLNAKQVHLGSFTALLTMDSKTTAQKGAQMRGLDMVVDCTNEKQLRDLLEKVVALNPIPYAQIRPLGPLISQTKRQQKQQSLI